MSPEMLVTDNEIAGYFLRFGKGIPVDDESLAMEAIQEAGKSGDFLNSPHTLKHFRQVLSRAQLAVRDRRGNWEAKGAASFEESAEQRVREILARKPTQYLDAAQQAELRRIEQSAMGN